MLEDVTDTGEPFSTKTVSKFPIISSVLMERVGALSLTNSISTFVRLLVNS